MSLRKLAHAIYRDCLGFKIENFQLKTFDIFLIFAQNIDCGYTLEPPHRVPTNYVLSKNKKKSYFLAEKFQFLKLKKSLFIAWASFLNADAFR